jgi:hypothetical protein
LKYLISFAFCLLSIPTLACINFSGAYEKPVQEMKDYLDLKVLKQTDCRRVDFYNASIYLPSELYMENPNPISYMLDGKQYCDAFGFCYSATLDGDVFRIKHSPKEFLKENGDSCVSETVSFNIDQSKALRVIRKCNDGTSINATYKNH